MPNYQFFNLKVKRIIESEVSVFLCMSLVIFGLVKWKKKIFEHHNWKNRGKQLITLIHRTSILNLFLESFYNNLIKKKDFFDDLPTWNSYHHLVLMRVCFYYGICQFLWIIYSHKCWCILVVNETVMLCNKQKHHIVVCVVAVVLVDL